MSTRDRPPEDSNTPKTLKIKIVLRNRSMELEIHQSFALKGLITYYVLFFIHLASLKVCLAGMTSYADEAWMKQMARNVTLDQWGFLGNCRYLLHDRDDKFCLSFVGMFPSSRMGYFIFILPPQEFIKLKAALSLKQITSLDDERRSCLHYRDKLKEVRGAKFDIWNPGFNPDDTDTWLDEKGNDIKPTKPSIAIYYADPPLPPMPGNSRTSLNHLFYDSTTGTCLAILEYPYG